PRVPHVSLCWRRVKPGRSPPKSSKNKLHNEPRVPHVSLFWRHKKPTPCGSVIRSGLHRLLKIVPAHPRASARTLTDRSPPNPLPERNIANNYPKFHRQSPEKYQGM